VEVLCYLKGSGGEGIFLPTKNDLKLYGYCDLDWGTCHLSLRSLTGYFVTLGSSPISQRPKKQAIVSRSSAEAKYHAIVVTTSELVWVYIILASLGVFQRQPMKLFCGSQAALHIARNPFFYERTKHIETDYRFVQERLVSGMLTFMYIRSQHQPTDILMKALRERQFDNFST